MDQLLEIYNTNIGQIDNFLNANREIQQMLGNINESSSTRNNRRFYVLGEYSIETLQIMYNQNTSHIERFMTLNREIQRAIINSIIPASQYTYEFTVPINNLLTPSEVTQASQADLVTSAFQSPVIVRPTPEQIEAATRRVKYGDISRPVNTTCPISLEPFTDEDDVIVIRHCGHIFKPSEFQTWFNANCRCPTCRYDIRG
jgi:hypothetical protein